MQDILKAFPVVLKHLDPNGTAVEPVVFAAWRRVVDGALAEHVVPLRLEGNRLIAAVSNETWRRQVADLGPAIAERINNAIGTPVVKFIEFSIDSEVVEQKRLESGKSVTTDNSKAARVIKESLKPAADSIADEDLRKLFLAAAAGSLARRKALKDEDFSE